MGASSRDESTSLTSIEICAGAGGQALGLHGAGFRHLALVEIDKYAHATLQENLAQTDEWGDCEALNQDLVSEFDARRAMAALGGRAVGEEDLDLLAGGVPCPPFSVAGKQLGGDDERDLFPRMVQLIDELKPRAVMIENVRGIMDAKFDEYCNSIIKSIEGMGYWFCGWHLLEARNYNVPQLRPRSIFVAIREEDRKKAGLGLDEFPWPVGVTERKENVFDALEKTMEYRRDRLIEEFPADVARIKDAYIKWRDKADQPRGVAPTLVGGSKKHGGADLGPSRAKAAWRALGVNALGVADDIDSVKRIDRDKHLEREFLRPDGPMLTVQQAALIQQFPETWKFQGGKTAQYRQVGNAFPPPVAKAVGQAIASVLQPDRREELLEGLQIEQLGAKRGKRAFQQPEIAEVLEVSVSPAEAPLNDCSGDLVGA
ncbi:DNA (cytosine-5-)-methyltransferase [Streptomyces decoyicus]|uniref:DNA cytosine methyltransferase n=1 Tax=Streptomyces decoyicus TaxID=249567 RepID=UPI002E2F4E77|nr:DNA (cytosine-5-)-methyltransferase [Streptomyces decoyicus]